MKTNRMILRDCMPFRVDPKSLNESVLGGEGNLYLRGTIQRADAPNGNGRVYPRNLLEREVNKYQAVIKESRALGELDHPSDKDIERDDPLTVLLKNASHMIRSIGMNGNDVVAEVQVLDFLPMGKILRGLLEHGVTVGISSRGFGSVVHDGNHSVVQNDIEISCWDMVWLPSTQGAFMEGYLKESSLFTAYSPKGGQSLPNVTESTLRRAAREQEAVVAQASPILQGASTNHLEEALEMLRTFKGK